MAYGIYGTTAPIQQQPKVPQATDAFLYASPASQPAVAQGAQPNQANPTTGAAAPNPFAPSGASPFALQPGQAPVAPAANPGSFEALLDKSAPARTANVEGAQKAISDMLMPSAGPSRESEAARSSFQKAQAEALRQGAEQSALAGRVQTGQILGDRRADMGRSLAQRADLENQLAIDDGNRADANRQAGISSLLQLEGLGEQSRASRAGLAMQDKQLAESARQFNTRQEFEEWATRAGWDQDAIARAWQSEESSKERTSREAVAFAGLSLEEKRLAQEAQQFTSKLDFDKWATQMGLDQQTSQRIWQSLENEKQRTSTEKVAFAGLSLEEKKLAQDAMQFGSRQDFDKWALTKQLDDRTADRIWQSAEAEKARTFTAGESALDRALNSSQFAERLGLDKSQFAEQIRQFNSREDFDRWATQKGLDQQDKELIWRSNEADVARKWETGERLGTQEHQVNITRLQGEVDKDKAAFMQVLGVQTMEKQAEIDTLAAATANEYQTARDTRAMTHEQAMETMKASMTAQLEQAGYDHDTAMQAAELHAVAVEKAKDREMATLEAKAELMYKYQSLASQEGISKEQIAVQREQANNTLMLGLKELGLDEQKITAAIASQEFQDRAGMIATMMEMGGDSADVADKAGTMFLALMKEKGLISDEQYQAGIVGISTRAPEPTTPRDPDKIYAGDYKTGIDLIDNPVGDIADSYNQLSQGNFVTAAKHAGETILTYPVKALRALKFW
jgi:hypothetical protein